MSFDNTYDDRVPAIAKRYRSYFTSTKRHITGETIWVVKREHRGLMDDSHDFTPASALVHAVHDDGGMLAEDFRMEWTVSILDLLKDADPDDDLEDLRRDFEGDTSMWELNQWLTSHAYRPGYVEATKGDPYMADWNQHDLEDIIRLGQQTEYEEVYGIILQHLREIAEEEDLASLEDE